MTTSLNTERDGTDILLTDNAGKYQGRIAYNVETVAPGRHWHVIARGGDPNQWWATQEAASFYALALYADRVEMNRNEEPDIRNTQTNYEVDFHRNN